MVLFKRGENRFFYLVSIVLIILLAIIVIAENNTADDQTSDFLQEEGNISLDIPAPSAGEDLGEPTLIKTILNLVTDKLSAIKGEIVNIKASLSSENNTPLADEQISFFANNISLGTDLTDESGLAEINWDTTDFDSEIYVIRADYAGNAIFEESYNNLELKILPPEKIDEIMPDDTANGTDELIEINKNKLNDKTKDYLKTTNDKREKRDYIVKFKNSIKKEKLKDIVISQEYTMFNSVKVNANIDEITKVIDEQDIQYIELDQDISALEDTIPYGISKVNAPSIWNSTKGDNVKVAVLDSGISSHNDLSIAGGYSAISEDYTDNYGHGTAVAGVISALLNDEGLVGVAPSSDIYAVKIMETSTGDLSDAIAGLEWAIDNDMNIISMSFGFDFYSQIFKEAVQEAYSSDVLLIAAAGNDGEAVLYPAAYTDVIAVGSVDSLNERASFSSYGYELELVAPGVDIESTSLNNGYSTYSGTSMSAPHVAGVAALIKSYDNSLVNTEIRAKLRDDALDLGEIGKDDYYGYGLVQVNLVASNYTLENESYFYEVFKIVNYKTPEEEYVFWLNGTGTIDDVDFPEGYYLIKKYIGGEVYQRKISVSEDGTIKALVYVDIKDDFTQNSTTTDGFVWINGNLTTYLSDYNSGLLDAECYDYDWDEENYFGPNEFDECFYKDEAAKTACMTFSQGEGSYEGNSFYDICTNNPSKCTQGIEQNHSIPTSAIRGGATTVIAVTFEDCGGGQEEWYDAENYYYVFDRKQAKCTGTNTYDYEGRFDTTYPTNNYYYPYKTDMTCNGICNPSLDEKPVADENGTIPNPCFSGNDLYIEDDDILVLKQGSQTNFTATIHSLNVDENNVEVTFFGVTSQNLIKQTDTQTINLASSDTSKELSVVWTVNFDDIRVAVDSSDTVDENDETNNQARVSAVKVKACLNISTGLPLVDAEIEDYLKKYVDSVAEADAEVTIAVGNPNTNELVDNYNQHTLSTYRWGYKNGKVTNSGKSDAQPYNAVVGSFYKNTMPYIFIYGNEIEGTLAGLKRLAEEKDRFLSSETETLRFPKSVYLGKYDMEAYSTWDFLRNTNNKNYAIDSVDFANIVENMLNDELYEESMYSIKEPLNNAELRIKHIGPTYSSALINASGNPVILAHGIHSDITTWEDFGQDLSQREHKNVWIIEPYGGPGTECDGCYAYDFSDLKTYYWPALMAGVEYYSGYTNSSYVGYDLGCTVALESLEDYNTVGKANAGTLLTGGTVGMSAYPIDTFVGVACIGNFTKSDYFETERLAQFADWLNDSRENYESGNYLYALYDGHLSGSYYKSNYFINSQKPDVTSLMVYIIEKFDVPISAISSIMSLLMTASFPSPQYASSSISMETLTDTIDFMNDDSFDVGSNVDINNLAIIQGFRLYHGADQQGNILTEMKGTDNFVSHRDEEIICSNVNSNNKYLITFPNRNHFTSIFSKGIADYSGTHSVINQFLEQKEVNYEEESDFGYSQDCTTKLR